MLDEMEFEFRRTKQLIDLEQGHRMSPADERLVKGLFYFAKAVGLKKELKRQSRARVFRAVHGYMLGKGTVRHKRTDRGSSGRLGGSGRLKRAIHTTTDTMSVVECGPAGQQGARPARMVVAQEGSGIVTYD